MAVYSTDELKVDLEDIIKKVYEDGYDYQVFVIHKDREFKVSVKKVEKEVTDDGNKDK